MDKSNSIPSANSPNPQPGNGGEACHNKQEQQEQQSQHPPRSWLASTTAPGSTQSLSTSENIGYVPIMDEERPYLPSKSGFYKFEQYASTKTNASNGSSVAKWFALETTDEDRLSCKIIREELKEVIYELYNFLRNRNWKKKLLTVAVVVAFVAVFTDMMFFDHIRNWIDEFLVWMTDYPTAAEFVFMGIYVLATILFIPPTLLLFGGGWAFAEAWDSIPKGVMAAIYACFFGSVVGALLSFVRARYMMRDIIELFAKRYPIVKAADQALKRDGLRIMFLLRLCPLIPFHGLNYLGGITDVSWQTFLLSLVGILPYQILIIIMGASAGSLHGTSARVGADDDRLNQVDLEQQQRQQLGLLIVTSAGLASLVIAMILAFRFTKKELQKELQIDNNDMESYITVVRRMSVIDLFDSYEHETMDTQDGVEITGQRVADMNPMRITRLDLGSGLSSSSVNFNAMVPN